MTDERIGSGRVRQQILHIDMDAFYAAVEVLDDPTLVGVPLIVGGAGRRGVVASCSYEARVFGVRSAMPSTEARRRCPAALFRNGRFDRYNEVSAQLHAILGEVSPLVEGIALDEAFVDITGATRLLGPAPDLASRLRTRVASELGLPCSVGVGSTKTVAKLASEAAKPTVADGSVRPGRGVVVVEPGDEVSFLHPLPVEALSGVGAVSAARLRSWGILTVGSLAEAPEDVVRSALGASNGGHLRKLALGIDDRCVVSDRVAKSVGHEETYATDHQEPAELARHIVRMADAVAERLRAHDTQGRTVVLRVRHSDFATHTRSRTLERPTNVAREIGRVATDLLAGVELAGGVRLLGVSVTNLSGPETEPEQLALALDSAETAETTPGVRRLAWSAAADAVASVRGRYGRTAIGPLVLLSDEGLQLRSPGTAPWGPEETAAGSDERNLGAPRTSNAPKRKA